MSVGERLKEARQAKGLSQATLAVEAGVRTQTIWRYEHGKTAPSGDVLIRLAQILGVSPQWLQVGEESHVESDGAYPALAIFLEGPEGQSVTAAERVALGAYRASHGNPTTLTYHFLLQAIRSEGEGSEELQRGAEITERAYRSALAKGAKPLKRKGKE